MLFKMVTAATAPSGFTSSRQAPVVPGGAKAGGKRKYVNIFRASESELIIKWTAPFGREKSPLDGVSVVACATGMGFDESSVDRTRFKIPLV